MVQIEIFPWPPKLIIKYGSPHGSEVWEINWLNKQQRKTKNVDIFIIYDHCKVKKIYVPCNPTTKNWTSERDVEKKFQRSRDIKEKESVRESLET